MKVGSIRLQFLLLLILLMCVVFASITFTIVDYASTTLRKNLVTDAISFASLSTQPIGNTYDLYNSSGTLHIGQQVNNILSLDKHINQVEIVSTTGHINYISNPSAPIKVSDDDLTNVTQTQIFDKNHHLMAIVEPYLQTYGVHQYSIIYGVSYDSVNKTIDTIIYYVVVVSIIILIISLIAWYLLINKLILSPVSNISDLALKISKGDLSQTSNIHRHDEIGNLSNAVTVMANSLKDDINKLKQLDEMKNEFLMITSHNLRTPLTVIEGYVDTLAMMELPDNLKQLVEPLQISVGKLRSLSEDVLTISTIESGNYVLHFEDIEMQPYLEKLTEDFLHMNKLKRINFHKEIDVHITLSISKTQLKSAILNLLDNAYKFTPTDGNVNFIAKIVDNSVEIKVNDSGPGIIADEIPKLFTKFHRATDTLKYNYEGTGIGLYISKIIIDKHGGTITAHSEIDHGATFIIRLPIKKVMI